MTRRPLARRNNLRAGFTLLEIIVVVMIIGIMMTAGVVSVMGGQSATRVRGAVRDITAQLRRARSAAMITQHPTYITFEERSVGDTVVASAIVDDGIGKLRRTVNEAMDLDGKMVQLAEDEESANDLVFDLLFPKDVREDVAEGIRIRVLKEGEEDELGASYEVQSSNIKASAIVDGRKTLDFDGGSAVSTMIGGDKDYMQGKAQFRWETNGRTSPYSVYVYADGMTSDKGVRIKVDEFGSISELSGEDRE